MTRLSGTNQVIRLRPEPYCPKCGAKMVLRQPREDQTYEPFWGCSQFPDCRGSRRILPNGDPDEPEKTGLEWLRDDHG